MTTVPGSRSAPGLEVVALHPTDAERAGEGGADRLHVVALADDHGAVGQTRSLEPAAVSAIVRATDLPVRVTLRLSPDLTTQGGEFTRLLGLVSDYLSLGVEGFVFGFLTPDLEVDVNTCGELVDFLGGTPWTFDRAFDHALEPRRAWRALASLEGLDSIHTAGAVRGMGAGFDDLMALASADPAFASVAVAAGGVRPEHVPWLVRAGVTRVHLGASVRPGGSWTKAHVDAGFVRSWRLLLDDATRPGHASGSAG
ncbi:MAG: copper homeostasis protein CutC [Nocardioidaceae bacterium]|nr:copper homeostasis protein CutC [Nocardioidaceae bacterium]